MIGTRVRVKVVKNKVAPPFKKAEFDIHFGNGIVKEGCLLDAGCDFNIIEKAGSWYSYKGQRIGQGKDNVIEFLKQNPQIAEEIEKQIKIDAGIIKDTDKKSTSKEKPSTEKDSIPEADSKSKNPGTEKNIKPEIKTETDKPAAVEGKTSG